VVEDVKLLYSAHIEDGFSDSSTMQFLETEKEVWHV
jgi:hypothetical protein